MNKNNNFNEYTLNNKQEVHYKKCNNLKYTRNYIVFWFLVSEIA